MFSSMEKGQDWDPTVLNGKFSYPNIEGHKPVQGVTMNEHLYRFAFLTHWNCVNAGKFGSKPN